MKGYSYNDGNIIVIDFEIETLTTTCPVLYVHCENLYVHSSKLTNEVVSTCSPRSRCQQFRVYPHHCTERKNTCHARLFKSVTNFNFSVHKVYTVFPISQLMTSS